MLCLASGALAQQPAAPGGVRVVTMQLSSQLMARTMPYQVALPPDYDAKTSAANTYPTLYLLHGLTGHYDNWLAHSKLAEYAAAYRLIIVTPEGNDGWYTDSATLANDKYESYIVKELLPDVEKRFRTRANRTGRAITGLSMGGYGALKFAVKYPDMFIFAGSLSGALQAAEWQEKDLPWKSLRDSVMSVYGPADSPTRAANDLFKIIRDATPANIKAWPYLYVACGTEDFLIAPNQALAKLLVDKKIPHEYRQHPGAHNWIFWDTQVREVLRLANEQMNPATR